MTKKNAKKMAARARKAEHGGKYMANVRVVERQGEEEDTNTILGATMRFSDPTLDQIRAAVAAANRRGVSPEAGWRITEGFPGGPVYEAIRASERKERTGPVLGLHPGMLTPMFDSSPTGSLACRCFEVRNDDESCLRILREAAHDRASHFQALETAARSALLERLGTIDELVGVPEDVVADEHRKDALLGLLGDHVAIAELWPDKAAFHDWISRVVDAVAQRFPFRSTWWTSNPRLLELRDGRV